MVSDILDSAPEPGEELPSDITPVDVHDCVSEFVSDQWEGALKSGRLVMNLPEAGHHWKLDLSRFYRIMNNLLSNALKYSEPDTQVTFTLKLARAELTLTVSDRGVGIPMAERAAIFERFHRAGNTDSIQGIGLGLSILKEAVEHHGGTVDVESIEGQGSSFVVRLPKR